MKIKLRYWSKRDKVMLDWCCILQTAFNIQSIANQHAATAPFNPLLYSSLYRDEDPMLWTGLRDKNNKEIYEGDIVEATSHGQHARCVVKWGQGRAGFFLHREQSGIVWNLAGGGEDYRVETCEVIGNIFETPELMSLKSESMNTNLNHARRNDSYVATMLDANRPLEDIIAGLVNQKEKLMARVLELENIAPKKIIVDGKTMVWHCPNELIPVSMERQSQTPLE